MIPGVPPMPWEWSPCGRATLIYLVLAHRRKRRVDHERVTLKKARLDFSCSTLACFESLLSSQSQHP